MSPEARVAVVRTVGVSISVAWSPTAKFTRPQRTRQAAVEEGADPTPRNESGYDAAGYAKAAGDPALAEWLAERAKDFRRRYGTFTPTR